MKKNLIYIVFVFFIIIIYTKNKGVKLMSIEQVQAFIEKAKKDEKLILKLYAAVENKDKVEIARQEGFEFTEEELTKERKRFNPGKSHLFQNRCIKKNAGYLLGIMHDIRKSSEGYPTDQKNRLDVLKHEKKLHLIFD